MDDIDPDTIDWPKVTDAQVEAMVRDGYSQRFIEERRREVRLAQHAAQAATTSDPVQGENTDQDIGGTD